MGGRVTEWESINVQPAVRIWGAQLGDADRLPEISVLDYNPWQRFRRLADGDVIRRRRDFFGVDVFSATTQGGDAGVFGCSDADSKRTEISCVFGERELPDVDTLSAHGRDVDRVTMLRVRFVWVCAGKVRMIAVEE